MTATASQRARARIAQFLASLEREDNYVGRYDEPKQTGKPAPDLIDDIESHVATWCRHYQAIGYVSAKKPMPASLRVGPRKIHLNARPGAVLTGLKKQRSQPNTPRRKRKDGSGAVLVYNRWRDTRNVYGSPAEAAAALATTEADVRNAIRHSKSINGFRIRWNPAEQRVA